MWSDEVDECSKTGRIRPQSLVNFSHKIDFYVKNKQKHS